MKFKKLNKSIMLGLLAILMLLAFTFAYFSDNGVFYKNIEGATFDIEVTPSDLTTTPKLMPGEAGSELSYDVQNVGNVDATIREKLLVFMMDDSGKAIAINSDTPELGLYTAEGTDFATKKVQANSVLYDVSDYELTASNNKVQTPVVKVNPTASNDFAKNNIYVGVIVEAKQAGDVDWSVVATETFNLAGDHSAAFDDAQAEVKAVAAKLAE